ncbi:unnamed protein product [Linum trigynum]|uniref:Uncharacterized protein n=1 Tax=Linum trigynum TaxID=586398 RepID=A0AAV2E9Q5_9ROSI
MVKTEDTQAPKRDDAGERMRRRTDNAAAADNAGEKSVFTRGGRRRTMRRRRREIADREASALLSAKGKRKREKGFGFGSWFGKRERNNKEGKRGARL